MSNPTPIKNDLDLLRIIGNDMKGVIDDLADWLLGQIEQSLLDNVYRFPAGDYERLEHDGGLLGAWKKEAVDFAGKYVSTQVGFDSSLLRYEPSLHQHGSLSEDRTKIIAQIVEEGTDYDFGGNATMARPFWDVVVISLENGSLDNAFENIMTKHGIVWQRA